MSNTAEPKKTLSQQNLAIRLLRVLRYNKARIERTISLLSDEHKSLFHVLPFLLHVNHERLPGYVKSKDNFCGLFNYTLRPDISEALAETFPNLGEITDFAKKAWPKQRFIESILLMGSVGTIAQDDHSDFDYWVCIDSKKLPENGVQHLQEKLSKIEEWAERHYGLEVHFFLSDIDSVCSNDFGIADGESAGSAQAVFLKAEFYTTNIVVAGKAPFWWLTPNDATDEEYDQLYASLKKGKSPDPNWVMNLGNLEKMEPTELFGAAIWQLSKAMDSPFKSVLKMAKLEVFLDNIDRHEPLCNSLKKLVHQTDESSGNIEPVDPYALMFDQLIEHYKNEEQLNIVSLLQECLYIKCNSQLSIQKTQYGRTFKHTILSHYVTKWGWDVDKIHELDHIETWSFAQHVALSKRIHSFLIQCYKRMSAKFRNLQHTVNEQDMTVLGRRLETYYAKKPGKLSMLRSGFGEDLYCPVATVRARRQKDGSRHWSLYIGDQLTAPDSDIRSSKVHTANTATSLITWCVINRVIDQETSLLLDYDADPVSEKDLKILATHVHKLFRPIKVNAIPREDLLSARTIVSCLAVLNFESSRLKAHVDEVTIVYSTSWGERFIEYGEKAVLSIIEKCETQDSMPECYMMTPHFNHRKRVEVDFLENASIAFDLLN